MEELSGALDGGWNVDVEAKDRTTGIVMDEDMVTAMTRNIIGG